MADARHPGRDRRPGERLSRIGDPAALWIARRAVEAIPLDNRQESRSVALFFLPELAPAERRTFNITYSWPGFFAEWFGPFSSSHWDRACDAVAANDVADVIYRFRFAPSCGRVVCETKHPDQPNDRLVPTVTQDGGTEWSWSNPAAAIGRRRWLLRFRRTFH